MSVSKEQYGDVGKNSLSKRTSHTTERALLRNRGYLLQDTIGEGTYSKVKRATSLALRREVAIKIISRDDAPTVFRQRFLPREIEILSMVQHPNVVKVYEIFEVKSPARVYIVTEYLGGGDLLDYVKARGPIADNDAKFIFFDISRAVGYLHDNYIAHRDIKCENILVDQKRPGQKFYAKLCDFGFARKFSSYNPKINAEKEPEFLTRTFCGSAAYASPEILERKPHNPMQADVWALGIVFFIALFGSMPFDDRDIKLMILSQKRDDIMKHRSKKVNGQVQDLIASALRFNPRFRPNVRQILRHPWFRLHGETKSDSSSRNSRSKENTPTTLTTTKLSPNL